MVGIEEPGPSCAGNAMPATVSAQFVPSYLELVPEELDLRVFRHTVETVGGPVQCWSYVTDGLRRIGQKELVFTLRRRPEDGEKYPQDPVDFIQFVFQRAKENIFTEAGGCIEFTREGGFLGAEGPVGFVLINAVPLKGVNYPDKLLSAYLTTAEELDAIRTHGTYRFLSLLGRLTGQVPYPVWSERNRRSLFTAEEMKQSLLSQLPLCPAPGIHVRRHRNQILIHAVDEKALDQLDRNLKTMPADRAFVMITDPDPAAKSRLVWKPGMTVETMAVDPRTDAMHTGGFFAVVPTRTGQQGAHICEDGFAVKLRAATWDKVRKALVCRDSLTVQPEGAAMPLVVGLSSEPEAVRRAGGHFFQDVAALYSRIKPDEMTWFDRRIGNIVEDHFADVAPSDSEGLVIFCAIRPGQVAKYWIECKPDAISNAGRSMLQRRLAALKPPAVTAPVAWALRFDLWGGTGDPYNFAHMPKEWADVNRDHSLTPEQILDRVWPA